MIKKSVSTRLNKSSSFPQVDQGKAAKTGWSFRLGHARRALSTPPPPKRAPSTTLTLRSKSMTAELEELERLDEMLAPQEPVMLRSQPTEADYRAATVKQRPTGRRITQSEISSLFERQGMALHGGLHPRMERAHMQLPRGMSRTKSFGNTFHL
uniref:SH3 and multiple ankyrin repeat domains 3 n=1 Tax=Hucho hucho TaxID=62062 RepID=A0A4W5M7V6_9TELE